MKKLIILVVLVVAGYFAYQHFYIAPQEEAVMEETEEADAVTDYNYNTESQPALPEGCQTLATTLENAIYGNKTGEVSFAQRNKAYREFKSCLRAEGFSGDQIDTAVNEIEDRVEGYLNQDSGL